jgi:hypothetical protein
MPDVLGLRLKGQHSHWRIVGEIRPMVMIRLDKAIKMPMKLKISSLDHREEIVDVGIA